MAAALRTLLSVIVDYAGLFPPAKLPMKAVVENYAAYLASEHAWMLGRLIVPVARLEEFQREAEPLLVKGEAAPRWSISALIGEDLDADIETIFDFNHTHDDMGAEHGAAVIDAIELKAADGRAVDRAMKVIPEQLAPFFEVPVSGDVRGVITAMSGSGANAKIRTGGVTPDAFPAPEQVARFILACAAAEVPFKATAGLHHPLRAEYPLTYEPGCPRGTMYGFLNVFMAAAAAHIARPTEAQLVEILTETDPGAFGFSESAASYRGREIENTQLAQVREAFAISFGSCSFEEPVDDLRALSLL